MNARLIACAAAVLVALGAGIPAAQAADEPCPSASTATTEKEAEVCATLAIEEEGPTLAVDAPGDPATVMLPDERYRHWGDEFLACLLNGLQQGLPLKQIGEDCAPTLKTQDGEGASGPGFGPLPPGVDPTDDEIFDPTAVNAPPQSGDGESRSVEESSSYSDAQETAPKTEGTGTGGSLLSCTAGDPGISGAAGAVKTPPYGEFTWGEGMGNRGLSYEVSKHLKTEAIKAYEAQREVAKEAAEEFRRLEKQAETAAKAAEETKSKTNNATEIRAAEYKKQQAERDAVAQAVKAVEEKQKEGAARQKASADPNQTTGKESSKKRPSREPSACEEGLQALRELMWECHRTNGQSSACQDLDAKLNGCPDQTLINVDPEQGYSCGLDVDMKALKDAWVAHCQELKDPGPDGHPCEPPTPDGPDPERAGEQNDFCRNPLAYVVPGSEECLPSGAVEEFGTPDMHEIMVWALNKLGGPVFDVPSDDTEEPSPHPGPRPDPYPGGATSSPDDYTSSLDD